MGIHIYKTNNKKKFYVNKYLSYFHFLFVKIGNIPSVKSKVQNVVEYYYLRYIY